jgi:hypothetical protein
VKQERPIRMISQLAALVAAFALLSLMPGCSKSKHGATVAPSSDTASTIPSATSTSGGVPGMRKTWGLRVLNQPGATFHVEYSDKTNIVDMATVGRTLRGVTEDRSIFLFEDSPELQQKLVPGKYVLFEGLDLRKVDALAIDPKTKNLVVGTERPNLREALKNANVQFSTPVDFGDLFGQLAMKSNSFDPPPDTDALRALPGKVWDWIQPTAYADLSNDNVEGEAEYSDSDFATWKCHFHYTRNADHSLNLDITLVREANGLNVDLHLKGKVSRFIQQTTFVMTKEGNMRQYFKNGGLHGDINFDWVVKTSEVKTPMNEVRFKLPGKLSIPLIELTKLPMSIEISEALLFHPAFTGKEEVAKGGFHATYSADQGFKVDNSSMQGDGGGGGEGEAGNDATIDQTIAFSPFAAFGLVVAVAAPRVELRMGMEEIWDMAKIPIPSSMAESLTDVLLKNTIAGQWLNKKVGNPLSIEGAAYFQLVMSTTAAHSGMQSLVPCQQFTMVAKGQLGIDAEWLGNNTNWPPVEVFSKNLTRRQPDAKICGGGQG